MTSTPDLLLAWDADRPRSKQRELGMSEIGGCRKRAGYKLGGYEPTNTSSSIQAVMGSAIHDAIASVLGMVAKDGDLTEYEVTFAGVRGHLDRFEADTGTVIDVKTTSSRWLEHIKLTGPDEPHRWQVSCYAAALVTEKKHRVRRVRIDYIARDTGECWSWEAPFDPRYVRDAFEWLRLVRDSPVEMLPRDYAPESVFCRNCPFRTPCWGSDVPTRESLTVLYAEHPDAADWAEQLWRARQDRKDAEDREKRAAGALQAIRPFEGGRVRAGRHTLDFRSNGLYFVSGDTPQPAVGYAEGDEAGSAA